MDLLWHSGCSLDARGVVAALVAGLVPATHLFDGHLISGGHSVGHIISGWGRVDRPILSLGLSGNLKSKSE